MVDVIIPIFDAFTEVQECVERVLKNSPSSASIVLIDDASTDVRIRALLGDLAASGDARLRILHNDSNLGFVRTANRGLTLSKNDVVLLNSDTLVPPLWIEKLQACAQSQPQVGTVTPFSNNAEICSYPAFCRETLVADIDLSALESALESVDDGRYPEIPTAVGFCMYIRRELIDAIGVFDADYFGQGYGEENDFCVRAGAVGFRHLLCTNTYVVHRGGRSFQAETQSLKERNLKTLLQRHPDYSELIARFVAADPIQPYRQRATDRLAANGMDALGQPMVPGILLITHRYGGGVDKHVMDLVHLLAGAARVEVLRPVGLNAIALDDCAGNRRIFDMERWPELVEMLRSRRYARAHIHHLHGYPIAILKLTHALEIPYDLTLHDFGVFCPQYSLTATDATYCGEPAPAGCNDCLRLRPHTWGLSIDDWRERMASLMVHAQRVISPSAYVTEKVRRRFPAIRIDMRPHPPRHEWLVASRSTCKVLILGGLSRAKGLDSVVANAWDAQHKDLPITFTLVGYPERSLPTFPELPLHITGEYADETLPALIQSERPDCIWFPGQTPESYSYTLNVALQCGLPIVAGRHQGALAERLEASAVHRLIDTSVTASQLNELFLNIARPNQTSLPSPVPNAADLALRASYRNWLLSALQTTSTNGLPLIAHFSSIQSNFDGALITYPPAMSLRSLYEQAVECGHRESRRALQQQLALIETDQQVLAAISEEAGKPWFAHFEDLRTSTAALQMRMRELEERNQQSASETIALRHEIAAHQESIRLQLLAIESRELRIEELQNQCRDLAEAAEIKQMELAHIAQERLREQQEQFEDQLRKMLGAFECRQNEMAAAHEVAVHKAVHTAKSEMAAAHDVTLHNAVQTATSQLIRHYEQSKSWRITAPLRATRSSLSRNFTRLSNVVNLVKRGWRRWPLAYTLARDEGVGALASRIQEKLSPPQPPTLQKYEARQQIIAGLSLATCPPSQSPHVTIVIPVYGQHQFTYNCLLSLSQHTRLGDVQIIVIDDCSPEPAAQAMPHVTGVQWIRNAENLGFIGSCNAAAAQAEGEYLVLLNNDVQVTPGWLEGLLSVFGTRSDCGMVGARLVYPDGRLQEAGGIVWQDGSAWNWGRDQDPEHPRYNYLRKADYCSGACLALRKEDWQALQGFDPIYAPAYYEDADLAFRVRASGKQLYYQPSSKVVHYEGVTSGTDETKGVKRHQVVNQVTFFERWKDTLHAHRPNAVQPWAEVARDAKKRVLIVEACMITPDQDAGSVRMQALMEVMSDMGVQVSFVADNLEYRQPYVHNLQQAGVEVWHRPHVQSVAQLLEQEASHFDVIIFCRHYIACQYTSLVKRHAPQAKIWFDTVDLHYLREERLAELQQSAKLASLAAETKRQEIGVMEQSDLTFVVSPVEQEILKQATPNSKIEILSLIHEPIADTPTFKQRRGLLFVGGFQHPPNIDAVQWFIAEVWPILITKLPDITLKVVGSKMPESLRSLAQPGVEILGFIPDIDPLLLSTKISIAPLRYGAGVKGKINQAMSYGLPVIATPIAVEGMGLTDGTNVLVAEAPEAFAEAIARLHGDEALWTSLVQGGKTNIQQTFSRAVARNTLQRLLQLS